MAGFDYTKRDSQATQVAPIAPEKFDFARYEDYEAERTERCRAFWNKPSGVAVYRRFRVAEVFSYGCADMESSLALQLGCLNASMDFEMDVPNFLEPWYGLGIVPAAFGTDYVWHPGQAPAVTNAKADLYEAMDTAVTPLDQTPIGRHNLEMIEYFLDKTHGRLPMSLPDVQTPLNNASNLMPVQELFFGMVDDPDLARGLIDRLADVAVAYYGKAADMIGDRLVAPGHGFPSSRVFTGLGLSDDVLPMLSDEMIADLILPAQARLADAFSDYAFHSCGNWERKIPIVQTFHRLRMVDAAFTAATDPDPNRPEPFRDAFAGSGVCVNARAVGTPDEVADVAGRFRKDGMKLIMTTYCESAAEQRAAYDAVHALFK